MADISKLLEDILKGQNQPTKSTVVNDILNTLTAKRLHPQPKPITTTLNYGLQPTKTKPKSTLTLQQQLTAAMIQGNPKIEKVTPLSAYLYTPKVSPPMPVPGMLVPVTTTTKEVSGIAKFVFNGITNTAKNYWDNKLSDAGMNLSASTGKIISPDSTYAKITAGGYVASDIAGLAAMIYGGYQILKGFVQMGESLQKISTFENRLKDASKVIDDAFNMTKMDSAVNSIDDVENFLLRQAGGKDIVTEIEKARAVINYAGMASKDMFTIMFSENFQEVNVKDLVKTTLTMPDPITGKQIPAMISYSTAEGKVVAVIPAEGMKGLTDMETLAKAFGLSPTSQYFQEAANYEVMVPTDPKLIKMANSSHEWYTNVGQNLETFMIQGRVVAHQETIAKILAGTPNVSSTIILPSDFFSYPIKDVVVVPINMTTNMISVAVNQQAFDSLATVLNSLPAGSVSLTPNMVTKIVEAFAKGTPIETIKNSIVTELKKQKVIPKETKAEVTEKVEVKAPEVTKPKVKVEQPITSINPVEILKSGKELWKTENADTLVNKLDEHQLGSLKNLFDKAIAGNKLATSEKSVITKNHLMELNKETNKYELTIGEYQGKFLYDTVRGKIVRLQMTQKPKVPVKEEVKPEVKPPEEAPIEMPKEQMHQSLIDLGFTSSQINRASQETINTILQNKYTPEQVSIHDTGGLTVFKEAKPEEVQPPVAQMPIIPKELEPLAKEARKYKNWEEFQSAVHDGTIHKLLGSKFSRGMINSKLVEYGFNSYSNFYNQAVSQPVVEVKAKEVSPVAEIKVPKEGKPIALSDAQRKWIMEWREQLAKSTTTKAVLHRNEKGEVIGRTGAQSNAPLAYKGSKQYDLEHNTHYNIPSISNFTKGGYGKTAILTVVDKILNGQVLTEKQKEIWLKVRSNMKIEFQIGLDEEKAAKKLAKEVEKPKKQPVIIKTKGMKYDPNKPHATFLVKNVADEVTAFPLQLTGNTRETKEGKLEVQAISINNKIYFYPAESIFFPDEIKDYHAWGAIPEGKAIATYAMFGKLPGLYELTNLNVGVPESKTVSASVTDEKVAKKKIPRLPKVKRELISTLKKMDLLIKTKEGELMPTSDMEKIIKKTFPGKTLTEVLAGEDSTLILEEIIQGLKEVTSLTGIKDIPIDAFSGFKLNEETGLYEVVDRPNFGVFKFTDYFRTFSRVLEKTFKSSGMIEDVTNAYTNILKEEERVMLDKKGFHDAIRKLKIEEKILFRMIDNPSKYPDIPQEVKDLAKYHKAHMEDMANRLGLPENLRKEPYLTHMFEYDLVQILNPKINKEGDRSIPQDLLLGLSNPTVPIREFSDPYLKKRYGKELGLIENYWKASTSYDGYALKKIYFDPIAKKIADIFPDLTEGTKVQINNWLKEDVMGRLSEVEKYFREDERWLDGKMNASMKRFHMKGEVKGSARKVMNVLTSVMYNVYLGFYPPSAVMQFFQKTLVFPMVTNKAFAQATAQIVNPYWRKFAKENSNVLYLRKYARLPALDEEIRGKVTRKIQNIVMFMFNSQDTDSVIFAFLAGYFEAKNAGLPEATAINRGEEVARRTMFIYSKVFRSVATRSTVGRALSMFTSFPLNFAEFLLDLGKGNRSLVYIDYFKKHPELLDENNKKLVRKSGKGLLKYLLILATAWYIEYKTRIKAMRYIGIDSFTNLLYYNPAFATVPIGIGKAVVSLLINQDVKTFKSEMKKLTPVQIVACLRLLKYLGVKVDNEFLKYFFREDQQKDIARIFFYLKPLPVPKKIEVPIGRTSRTKRGGR